MRTFSLSFCLLILNSYLAQGQKDYAVSIKGDTLKGKIKMYSYENLDRVQINTSKKKTVYTALQVRRIVKGDVAYQTAKRGNAYRFMKVIKQGPYLSLLAFNGERGTWEGRFLLKRDGTGLEVSNAYKKNIISDFLSDCDRTSRAHFPRNKLEEVVDIYNTCIQEKNESLYKQGVLTTSTNSEKATAIVNFSQKVEAINFLTKKDVLDLLADIKAKVSKNEVIPSYLMESLKTYLNDTPDLLKEADELIILLKK